MSERPENLRELPASAVHVARTAEFLPRPIVSWTLSALAAGLILGLIGATGSYNYSAGLRVAIWLTLCVFAGTFGLMIEAALSHAVWARRTLTVWWLCCSMGMAILMLPVVFLLNSLGGQAPLSSLPLYALNCVIISSGLVGLRIVVGRALGPEANKHTHDSSEKAGVPLLERLKPALRDAQLLSLKSEGHYVLVGTDRGDELLLMRLRDAINEVGDIEGMQVHRSWWIARSAVEAVNRKNDAPVVTLINGSDVTISRSFRPKWREAAWV